MGGTYIERPYRCIPGASKGKSKGGTQGPVIDWQEEKRRHDELRRQQEAEERRRQLEEAERKAKQRAQEAAEKFAIEKRDALNSLKGTGPGTLQIKGSEMRKPFGIQASPDVELKISGKDSGSITKEWKQHYCGRWVIGYIFPAAKKGDVDEVRFLGTQALKSFRGGPLELQCPETQPPPQIYEGVVIGPDSPVEKFYMKILRLSEKEAVRLMEAEKQIWKVRAKKQKVQKEIADDQNKVNKIKEEIKELKRATAPPAAEGEEKKVAKEPEKKDMKAKAQIEEKKRALEAALAALKRAQKAEADVDKTVAKAEKERSDAQKNIKEYEDMFNKVKKKPALAKSYMDSIGN